MIQKTQQETEQNKIQKQKYWKSFITGGFAGICAKTVISPFERIKLLYVTRNKRFSYKAAFGDVKFIYQKHGIWNFFRGNAANAIRVFPFASINFSSYDFLRNTFWKPFPNEKAIQKKIVLFLCGSFAGMTATSVTYPLEFVRTRLAMEKSNFEYTNFFGAMRKIINEEGVRTLYQGWSIAMLGVFTYHGFAFFCISSLKQKLIDNGSSHSKAWYTDFVFGGVASFIGQAISYPIDIVRKRVQGQQFLLRHREIDRIYNIPGLIQSIYQNEGVLGFYKGLSINLVKGPLATGTVWTIKNKLNRILDKTYDF